MTCIYPYMVRVYFLTSCTMISDSYWAYRGVEFNPHNMKCLRWIYHVFKWYLVFDLRFKLFSNILPFYHWFFWWLLFYEEAFPYLCYSICKKCLPGKNHPVYGADDDVAMWFTNHFSTNVNYNCSDVLYLKAVWPRQRYFYVYLIILEYVALYILLSGYSDESAL